MATYLDLFQKSRVHLQRAIAAALLSGKNQDGSDFVINARVVNTSEMGGAVDPATLISEDVDNQLVPGKFPKLRSPEELRKYLERKQKEQERRKRNGRSDATKRNT